jgi:hypothetical protein
MHKFTNAARPRYRIPLFAFRGLRWPWLPHVCAFHAKASWSGWPSVLGLFYRDGERRARFLMVARPVATTTTQHAN